MYSQTELAHRISGLIEAAIEENLCVTTASIAQTIFDEWPPISGPGKDRYELKAWDGVCVDVRKALNRYKSKPEAEKQLVLPGYQYLQKAYSVRRDGEPTIVPVNLLTDKEIVARVAEYQRMADGCMKHAEELMGYLTRRRVFQNTDSVAHA